VEAPQLGQSKVRRSGSALSGAGAYTSTPGTAEVTGTKPSGGRHSVGDLERKVCLLVIPDADASTWKRVLDQRVFYRKGARGAMETARALEILLRWI
jgi:hypothetical protein